MATIASSIAIYYFKNIAILLIVVYLWILVIKENENFKVKIPRHTPHGSTYSLK